MYLKFAKKTNTTRTLGGLTFNIKYKEIIYEIIYVIIYNERVRKATLSH